MRYFAGSILWCIFALAQTPDVDHGDKCSVEGTVINSVSGEPVKKAAVTLSPMRQGTSPYTTITDAAGHFLIDEVDAGRFRLTAYRSGYIEPSSPHGNPKYSDAFTLEKGQKMKEIALNLVPQGVISGRILDEDGDPLGNVAIQCLSIVYDRGKRRLEGNGSINTNELGEFRLPGLSAGKYIVSATAQSNEMRQRVHERPLHSGRAPVEEAYVTTYYPSTINPGSASPIMVSAGTQVSGINITLTRIQTLSVKGHVSTGAPSRHAYMSLFSRENTQARFAEMDGTVDPNGNFQLTRVVPGSYILLASDTVESVEGKRYSARMPLEVHDANIEGIELELEPPAEIQGRLVVEDNGDLKSKPFRLLLQSRGVNGHATWLHLLDESTFQVEEIGYERPYDVLPSRLPGDFYVKSIRLGERDVLETGFDFTPGTKDVLTLVLNPNGGQIEGSVQNAKDEPAAGAKVTLIPDADHRSYSRYYKTADTDQNGHFSIKGVAPGEYKIYAWEDIEDGAYEDPDFVTPHESDGQSVSIKEKAHETVQLKVIPAESTASGKPTQ
jgi:protocatechuate 3,4-dioxygenase beta subunit